MANDSLGNPMFGFTDLDQMKEDVKKKLIHEAYDVKDFYKKTGFWQKIARHPVFENFTLVVIAINALWMWIDTDYNGGESPFDTHALFLIGDQLFCVYFTFEWFTRFQAFENKFNCRKDAWFVFDSVLVFLMVAETWILFIVLAAFGMSGGLPFNASILRLLRLARLSRMLRMLRSMPELLILVKGMGRAMKSVGYVMMLLLILLYVFAIGFVQLLKETDSGTAHFPSIPPAMWTLFCAGTLLDGVGAVLDQIGADSTMAAAGFILFLSLSALMVMNMLIGVLCEVVSAVAEYEKEQMLLAFVKERMQHCLATIDEDGDGSITRKEFFNIVAEKEAIIALQECGVDPLHLIEFTDQIFEEAQHTTTGSGEDGAETEEEPALTFECFMDVILRYRGTNTATVADIMDYRKFLMNYVDMKIKKQTKEIVTMIQMELAKRDFGEMPLLSRKSPRGSFGATWPDSPQSLESIGDEASPRCTDDDPTSQASVVEGDLFVRGTSDDSAFVRQFTPVQPTGQRNHLWATVLPPPPAACKDKGYPKQQLQSLATNFTNLSMSQAANGLSPSQASCTSTAHCADAVGEDAIIARIRRLSEANRKKILALSENAASASSMFKTMGSYSTLGNTTDCDSEGEDADSVVGELPVSSLIAGRCPKPGGGCCRRD